jgi:hypothetical protein
LHEHGKQCLVNPLNRMHLGADFWLISNTGDKIK